MRRTCEYNDYDDGGDDDGDGDGSSTFRSYAAKLAGRRSTFLFSAEKTHVQSLRAHARASMGQKCHPPSGLKTWISRERTPTNPEAESQAAAHERRTEGAAPTV